MPTLITNHIIPNIAKQKNNKSLQRSIENPLPKSNRMKKLPNHSSKIKLAILHQMPMLFFLIVNPKPNNRQTRKNNIKKLVNKRIIQRLAAEARAQSEPKLGQNKQNVFVKVIANDKRIFAVRFAAVDIKQFFQKREFGYGIVAGSGRLAALNAKDSYAYVRCADHVYVVCAVTDR